MWQLWQSKCPSKGKQQQPSSSLSCIRQSWEQTHQFTWVRRLQHPGNLPCSTPDFRDWKEWVGLERMDSRVKTQENNLAGRQVSLLEQKS